MKTTSLTISRNKQITGNNSKSYNDKHPENPISLRPIRDACKATIKHERKLRGRLHRLARFSRPTIAHLIACLTLR